METSVSSTSWTEQQIAFAKFLAANKIDVDMRRWTEAEYAQAIGVTDRTLRAWKQLPGFWVLVSELVPDTLHKFIPAIMQKQVKGALEGDINAAKLVMNQADRLKSEKKGLDADSIESVGALFGMLRDKARVIDGNYTEVDPGTNRVDGGERPTNLPS